MASDVWLNTAADGNMSNPVNYQSGQLPIASTTIQDQAGGSSNRPTSGSFIGSQWDINGNGPYNQSGDSANFGNVNFIDTAVGGTGNPSWSFAGANVVTGSMAASSVSTLYGTGVLATASQVKSGVTNGPYTGSLVAKIPERNRLQA